MAFVRFMDMASGGSRKEEAEYIYIEVADVLTKNQATKLAKLVFQNHFGHNPDRVTCTCCGQDYAIGWNPSLGEATAFERGCDWDYGMEHYLEQPGGFGDYVPLEEWLAKPTKFGSPCPILVIRAEDIKPEEYLGALKKQGYQWVDELND